MLDDVRAAIHSARRHPGFTLLDVVDLRRETGIFQDAAGRGVGVADLTSRTGGDRHELPRARPGV